MIIALLTVLLQDNKKGRKLKRLILTDEKQTIFRCLLIVF